MLRNPHQNPLIYLKDITYKDLEMIVQFIYLGHCNVKQLELDRFLSVGRDLEVIGLLEEVNPNIVQSGVGDNGTGVSDVPRRDNAEPGSE